MHRQVQTEPMFNEFTVYGGAQLGHFRHHCGDNITGDHTNDKKDNDSHQKQGGDYQQ